MKGDRSGAQRASVGRITGERDAWKTKRKAKSGECKTFGQIKIF